VTQLVLVAIVAVTAAAFGVKYSQQITHGVSSALLGVWQLSYVAMVAYLFVQAVREKTTQPYRGVYQAVDLYLGSWWGIAAACIAAGWWARRTYMESARSKYVTGLVNAHHDRLKAAGLDPLATYQYDADEDGEDDEDDEDDDGPPDAIYAAYSATIERAGVWAHATTYAFVVVPLFVISLFL
jgi:hypothetical protein